jgi:hypothetical protein
MQNYMLIKKLKDHLKDHFKSNVSVQFNNSHSKVVIILQNKRAKKLKF